MKGNNVEDKTTKSYKIQCAKLKAQQFMEEIEKGNNKKLPKEIEDWIKNKEKYVVGHFYLEVSKRYTFCLITGKWRKKNEKTGL